jgi:hypothetical protein
MQFSVGYICILAVFMTAPFLQVLAQADSASGDAADVQAVFGVGI